MVGGKSFSASEVNATIGSFLEPDATLFIGSRIATTAFSPDSNKPAGRLSIQTNRLSILDGAEISTDTLGGSLGGTLEVNASELVEVKGAAIDGTPSRLSSRTSNLGNGGNIQVTTPNLIIRNGAQVSSSTFSPGGINTVETGTPGNIQIRDADSVTLFNRGSISMAINAKTIVNQAEKVGGNIEIQARRFSLIDNSRVDASSAGRGNAGNISIFATRELSANNSDITTAAETDSGGNININAGNIFLRNVSNIRTDVSRGKNFGGNIRLSANAIVALENSNILAFAPEGQGGDIFFDTRAFLSDPLYRPKPPITDLTLLTELLTDSKVDVNASGAAPGTIAGVPDIIFLQNSLTQLPQNAIDTNALLSNSCIARNQNNGAFYITGSGGLPTNPGELSAYSTGSVQPVNSPSSWKQGDAIVEPQGIYQLSDGQLVLSRDCSQ